MSTFGLCEPSANTHPNQTHEQTSIISEVFHSVFVPLTTTPWRCSLFVQPSPSLPLYSLLSSPFLFLSSLANTNPGFRPRRNTRPNRRPHKPKHHQPPQPPRPSQDIRLLPRLCFRPRAAALAGTFACYGECDQRCVAAGYWCAVITRLGGVKGGCWR